MVSKAEKLMREEFQNQATTEKAGELLFTHQIGLDVLRFCRGNNSVIIGMNFWQKRGDYLVEINSTDYSRINQGPTAVLDTNNSAFHLIQDGLPDNADYVSFVLSGEEIEE